MRDSSRSFLRQRIPPGKAPELFEDPYGALAATSLSYIRHVARESCPRVSSESSSPSSPDPTALGTEWKLWNYACTHWGIHAGRDFSDGVEAAFCGIESDDAALPLWSQYLARTAPGYPEYQRVEQPSGAARGRHINEGTTPIHIAAVYSIARLVSNRLVGGNDRDEGGAAPLMRDAATDRVDMMELLRVGNI